MSAENQFKKIWEAIESPQTQPKYLKSLVKMDYQEFARKVTDRESDFISNLIESLYAGDCYIFQGAFSESFMRETIEKVDQFWSKEPSSFHKMTEGCPDFHRIQDEEVAAKYVFKSVRHSYYCFHWNGDPLGIIPPIMERWRLFKFIGGYRFDEYETNTPKDGIVDRIQVARYLPQGYSETHVDPFENQKVFISGFMGKRGIDYERGGFYVVGEGDKFVDVEDDIEVGDVGIGYATVAHGVDRIDPHKEADWDNKDGRWWLGLYSNSTDTGKKRATGKKLTIELKK
jgi:hypothetical protein